MKKPSTPAAEDLFNEVCTIRIVLRGTKPVIWRKVDVPTSISLKVLHDIIQITMGWHDSHLWEFNIDGQRFGPPMEGGWDDAPPRPASKTRLRDVLYPEKTVIDYLYDFGDSWEHRLTVSKIRQGDADKSYPRYLGGKGGAPPEDCGGLPGFYMLLEALADPDNPEHAEWLEYHPDFTPELEGQERYQFQLDRIATRRAAGRKPAASG